MDFSSRMNQFRQGLQDQQDSYNSMASNLSQVGRTVIPDKVAKHIAYMEQVSGVLTGASAGLHGLGGVAKKIAKSRAARLEKNNLKSKPKTEAEDLAEQESKSTGSEATTSAQSRIAEESKDASTEDKLGSADNVAEGNEAAAEAEGAAKGGKLGKAANEMDEEEETMPSEAVKDAPEPPSGAKPTDGFPEAPKPPMDVDAESAMAKEVRLNPARNPSTLADETGESVGDELFPKGAGLSTNNKGKGKAKATDDEEGGINEADEGEGDMEAAIKDSLNPQSQVRQPISSEGSGGGSGGGTAEEGGSEGGSAGADAITKGTAGTSTENRLMAKGEDDVSSGEWGDNFMGSEDTGMSLGDMASGARAFVGGAIDTAKTAVKSAATDVLGDVGADAAMTGIPIIGELFGLGMLIHQIHKAHKHEENEGAPQLTAASAEPTEQTGGMSSVLFKGGSGAPQIV